MNRHRIDRLVRPRGPRRERGPCIYLTVNAGLYLRRKLSHDLAWLAQCVTGDLGKLGQAAVAEEPRCSKSQDRHQHDVGSAGALDISKRILASAGRALPAYLWIQLLPALRVVAKISVLHPRLQKEETMGKASAKSAMDAEIITERSVRNFAPVERTAGRNGGRS